MDDFKRMFLFLILIVFTNCAEFQNAYGPKSIYITCAKKIFGKWEVFSTNNTLNKVKYNEEIRTPDIWIFNENDTATINKKTMRYGLNDDCSKLAIEYDEYKVVFRVRQYNDTLYLSQDLFIHESITIGLKKIN